MMADNNELWKLLKDQIEEDKKKLPNVNMIMRSDLYRSKLLTIAKGRFDIRCPEWWDKDYMITLLLTTGRVFIADSPIGVAPFNGSPYGLNVFERAPFVTITNPILDTFDCYFVNRNEKGTTIDVRGKSMRPAVCVYLYDNKIYRSIQPYIDLYASRLAMIDGAFDVNIFNSKLPWIFNVSDAKQKETAETMYEEISNEKPAIFVRKGQALNGSNTDALVEVLPVKESFIADKLQEIKRAVIGEFLTDIGVNNTSYEKRERLITDEVNSNNEEICCNVDYMKQNLKDCSETVRNAFGLDFDIRVKEGVCNEEREQVHADVHQETDT